MVVSSIRYKRGCVNQLSYPLGPVTAILKPRLRSVSNTHAPQLDQPSAAVDAALLKLEGEGIQGGGKSEAASCPDPCLFLASSGAGGGAPQSLDRSVGPILKYGWQ